MQVERIERELRAAIEAAWRDATRPGDVSAGYENAELVRRALVGTDWRDVDPAFAKPFAYGDNLALLDPAAFAYYLPAFLLLDVGQGSMPLVEVLAPVPKRWRNPDNLDRFWARVDALTEDQKRAIAQVLAYWRTRAWISDTDWDAVLEYWQPYLA